ncbi:MAG: prepilin-type N-terminal cleavage/methylation domain-containing protein, partial [Bdellovibrionales bacterium]|nr:prepilin-type N-terminal cleavage/methylation domain-containing protein [Bdellovibrionales bacterium]
LSSPLLSSPLLSSPLLSSPLLSSPLLSSLKKSSEKTFAVKPFLKKNIYLTGITFVKSALLSPFRKSSHKGFSIVELLIAITIMTIAGLGVAKLSLDIGKFQRNTLVTSEVNEFSAAIGYYLNQNCKAELAGEKFPATSPTDLTLDQYGSFVDVPVSVLKKGIEFEGKYKIEKLTWEYKSSIPIKKYKRAGDTLEVAVASITIQMSVMSADEQNVFTPLNPYRIEIPFVIEDDGTNKIVRDCLSGSLGPVGEDICETMGSEYDSNLDTCMPKSHCFIVTQFVNCTSDKGWNPTFSPTSPCETLVLPHISLNGKKQYFNFYHDDAGGTLGTCPSGTKMIFTGNIIKMGSLSCGPGCQNSYVSEGKVYFCVKCDMPGTTP